VLPWRRTNYAIHEDQDTDTHYSPGVAPSP
jgi:hypothetical protein